MSSTCFFCRKRSDNGNNVSHAKNRTKRLRRPNLHTKNLMIEGVKSKVQICSRCLRKLKMPAKTAQAA